MTLIEEDGTEVHTDALRACSMEAAGVHDTVLLTLKAHQVGPIAQDLRHLIGPNTTLVTMQNGIPWWYFLHGYAGPHAGTHVETADPGGLIAAALDPARVIGSVVFPAAILMAPNVVKVVEGNRFTLGEPDGTKSARVEAVAAQLVAAGFKAPVIEDIRAEIWLKLWGNASFNPVSALTHATLEGICRFPETRRSRTTSWPRCRRWPPSSASASASGSRSASKAPRRSGRTRPPCCRTSRRGGPSSSRRWSAR